MLIDILIPCYKAEETLPRAIKSVREQTYQNWHAIIVDDGSPDRVRDIALQAAQEDARITALANPVNLGLANSRNRALQATRGEWVAFLDADDFYTPDHISNFVNFQKENPEVEVFVGQPEILGEEYVPFYHDLSKMVHASEQAFEGSTFIKRQAIEKLDIFFSPEVKSNGVGHEFYERLHKTGLNIAFLPGKTCFYDRTREGSLTKTAAMVMRDNRETAERIISNGRNNLPYCRPG